MWITTTVSIIAVFLAHISRFKSKEKYLEICFVLLTITSAIQYGYGTDYMHYYDLWEQYSVLDVQSLVEDFFNPKGWQEPGWILLNTLFGFKNGFFLLVALISIVENFIYYRLVKEYVPAYWRWLAVFLYVGMDCLYLLNFSMLRQGLCVSLFVAAVMLMNKRKLLPAVILIFLSLTIHISSVICIPFIAFYFLPLNNTRIIAISLLIITFVLFVFKNVIVSGLNLMLTIEELGKFGNSGYMQQNLGSIGFGYLLDHIPNFVIIYLLLKDTLLKSKEQKVIILLAVLDILITPLQFYGATMAGRIGFYFLAFRVAAVPMIYGKINNRVIRLSLLMILIFMTLVQYLDFFNNYTGGYSEGYKTIFSVL